MTRFRIVATSFTLLVTLLVSMPLVVAQQSSGSISGIVQDGQGAVVPYAKVTLLNQAQRVVARELVTSALRP